MSAVFGEPITDPEVQQAVRILKLVDRYHWTPTQIEALPVEWISLLSQWNDGLDNARNVLKDME